MGGGSWDGPATTREHSSIPIDRDALLFDTYPMSQGQRELMRKESFDSGYAAGLAEGTKHSQHLRRWGRIAFFIALVSIIISLIDTKEVTRVTIYYPAGISASEIQSIREIHAENVKWYQWIDMEPIDKH